MKQMLLLKRELVNVASSVDTSRRCIYVDYPLHANIGDLLINLGSEQFFADQKLHIWKRYNQYDFPAQIKGIREDDVFLLHGGGNLGDLWEPYQSFRESILQRYPNNRIIFLPQTVHFQSREREKESMRKMSAHRNLHVFVRDYVSLKRLQAAGLECVSMAPDMAHALIGVLKSTSEPEANSELHLIRADKEGSQPPVEFHADGSPIVDWERGTIAPARRLAHPYVLKVVKGIGRYMRPLDAHSIWYRHRDGMIIDGVKLLSRHETIVTNRLHAILLGLLLGRKVRAWDNSYGKLSAYYDAWLSDVSGLTFYQGKYRQEKLETAASALGV
ncbi:MAG TPA: polysaccharide pyruvyl transferase family protein [Terriglobales bacterium]|nr:polysaccharide pyruvyl transferase family protein [Terriglobales bacterium]